MASPSIGGSALSIATEHVKCGGAFHFHRQQQSVAGSGSRFSHGEQWAEWDWKALTIADFNTLRTAWGTNPTAFELWSDDEKATAVSFTTGTMLEPTHGEIYGNGHFLDVHVEFRGLLPLVA